VQLDLVERYAVTIAWGFPEKEDVISSPLAKWLLETIFLDSDGRRAIAKRFRDRRNYGERCQGRRSHPVNLLECYGTYLDTHFIVWQGILY
jgi:hypothetical protein